MKWVNKYWSTFGGLVAIGIIVFVLLSGKDILDDQSLVWTHFAFLLLHQFEEYTYPGKFRAFYNAHIWNKNPITKSQLTEKGVLFVNVILAWPAYLLAAIYVDSMAWLTIGLAGVTLLNGALHTLMFLGLRKYNPGFLTGFFLFIPFGLFLIYKFMQGIEANSWIDGVFVFIIGIVLIPLFIRITNSKKNSKE